MLRSDFNYHLPEELIAQTPAPGRGDSRLLELDGRSGHVTDRAFAELPLLLRDGDLLVLNDTRVIPARLLGHKESGGAVELLVERVLDEKRFLAQARASKPPKPGNRLCLEGSLWVEMVAREGDLFEFVLEGERPILEALEAVGRIPLPPYIERVAQEEDRERYQTVFARERGAVAAPTAGLHFDEAMLERLRGQGVEVRFLTLHVGAGTFQPMRVERLNEHRMHAERIEVSKELVEAVNATHAEGGRVIAVGTTVVRALESAARDGVLHPFSGETDIFIYPGFEFRVVDAMLTNFHLPESTLLMLVCAFAGTENVLAAYRHAVEQRYRFFSYGDAMLIHRL